MSLVCTCFEGNLKRMLHYAWVVTIIAHYFWCRGTLAGRAPWIRFRLEEKRKSECFQM